jgi:3-oxoacyl-[acyl-carrier protein] reductase
LEGIGAAIAENLASKGCNLILNYTSSASTGLATLLAGTLSSTYAVTATPLQVDLTQPGGPSSLVEQSLAASGAPQIDILINNAGVAHNDRLEVLTEAQFSATYAVNVLAPLLLTQAARPHLPADRSGRVVNISSVSSGAGFVGQSVYGGTKAALEAMTRTWARELSERATVNAVTPGPVEGPMYAANSQEFKDGIRGWIAHTPLMRTREGVDPVDVVREAAPEGGRPAYTHEVAGVVGMLCTTDAAWVTGQVISANGGMIMMT